MFENGCLRTRGGVPGRGSNGRDRCIRRRYRRRRVPRPAVRRRGSSSDRKSRKRSSWWARSRGVPCQNPVQRACLLNPFRCMSATRAGTPTSERGCQTPGVARWPAGLRKVSSASGASVSTLCRAWGANGSYVDQALQVSATSLGNLDERVTAAPTDPLNRRGQASNPFRYSLTRLELLRQRSLVRFFVAESPRRGVRGILKVH